MTTFENPRKLRLLTAGDFQFVFDQAELKVPDKQVLVLARPNPLGHPRLGFVISKKNVRKAVQRNRVRRIIRESFRLHQHQLPAVDLIVLARKGIDELDAPELHKLAKKSWSRLNKKAKNLTSQHN